MVHVFEYFFDSILLHWLKEDKHLWYTKVCSQIINALSYKSSFLGCLKFTAGGVAPNILFADSITNPSSYLNGRPQSNNFTVQILQNNGSFIDYLPPSNYVLTLYLEEI